jgi:formate hydrogenlyase subunit 3/multisubunit Na+/H+ antiporter MnhD subunit
MSLIAALGCIGVLLLLAPAAVVLGNSPYARKIIYTASGVVSATMAAAGLAALLSPESSINETLSLPLGLPWLGAHFRLDRLSAFFLIVVDFGAAAASLYAIGYGRGEQAQSRILPFYPVFLAAMNLVVLSDDAFMFLVSWEFMSLTSWALVIAHHEKPENLRAGYVYLVMASFGTLCLLLAFALLAGADGGYAFSAIEAQPRSDALNSFVIVLALIGAGSKAGLVPLHVWLPLAHPAAPSHVSALMSGVMTKVAVYGFVRIAFDLIGAPEWWLAMIVLALGGGTAVIGVLHAMVERDLKKLLAYSTVENIGIIFVGIGLAIAFRANHLDTAAALALTASLLHVLNHSLFKSLLFFGAGAVLHATGLRDLERLGGLIHRMPGTSLAFLAGSMAISALPPFNGFVSEWLTFQAILLSPSIPQWGLKLMVPAVGALLALSAALAGACFVRAFGLTFLGRPHDLRIAETHEADRFSLAAMAILAILCLLAGILPGLFIDFVGPVVASVLQTQLPRQSALAWLTIVPIGESRSSYNGLLVFLFICLSASLIAIVFRCFASRALRRSDPWDCGFPDSSPITQYTASSFAQPLRRVFANVGISTREKVEMPPPGSQLPAVFSIELRDVAWDYIYAPIAQAVSIAARILNHLQFLTIRRYLSLVFAALIFLLLVLVVAA